MATLDINLPDSVKQIAEAKAIEGGFASVEEYIVSLIEDDAGEFDDATQEAIDRGETEYRQGKGIAADQAFEQLRHKHFGK